MNVSGRPLRDRIARGRNFDTLSEGRGLHHQHEEAGPWCRWRNVVKADRLMGNNIYDARFCGVGLISFKNCENEGPDLFVSFPVTYRTSILHGALGFYFLCIVLSVRAWHHAEKSGQDAHTRLHKLHLRIDKDTRRKEVVSVGLTLCF